MVDPSSLVMCAFQTPNYADQYCMYHNGEQGIDPIESDIEQSQLY